MKKVRSLSLRSMLGACTLIFIFYELYQLWSLKDEEANPLVPLSSNNLRAGNKPTSIEKIVIINNSLLDTFLLQVKDKQELCRGEFLPQDISSIPHEWPRYIDISDYDKQIFTVETFNTLKIFLNNINITPENGLSDGNHYNLCSSESNDTWQNSQPLLKPSDAAPLSYLFQEYCLAPNQPSANYLRMNG